MVTLLIVWAGEARFRAEALDICHMQGGVGDVPSCCKSLIIPMKYVIVGEPSLAFEPVGFLHHQTHVGQHVTRALRVGLEHDGCVCGKACHLGYN